MNLSNQAQNNLLNQQDPLQNIQQKGEIKLRRADRTKLCYYLTVGDGTCHHNELFGFPCPYAHEFAECRDAKKGKIALLPEENVYSLKKLLQDQQEAMSKLQ